MNQTTQAELHGVYYSFDCMNAFLSDRFFEVTAFENEKDAVKTAANYEATLYKHTFNHGEQVDTVKLYDPWDCFNQ